MLHHIFCGDSAADAARTAGLTGEILVWKDSSAVGPCSADPAVHRRLRGEWWGVDPSDIQLPSDLPWDETLVAWFGPDPWEQVALLELLAHARRPLTVVPLDRAVPHLGDPVPANSDASGSGYSSWYSSRTHAAASSLSVLAHTDAPPEPPPAPRPPEFTELLALLADRRPAPDRIVMHHLWALFCVDDPARDRDVLAIARASGLPHLAQAMTRVLADRRTRLTEHRVRTLVAAGTTELPALMRALAALEAPQHGAWYGDIVVSRLRDAALRA